MRNVVPRQGTETLSVNVRIFIVFIEKCSSPTGDGNAAVLVVIDFRKLLRNVVPRQGTETAHSLYVALPLSYY